MKNFIINSLSILAGKRFARLWAKGSDKSLNALETYKSLRRKLPVQFSTGNHIGNHVGSKYRPWLATQGCKVRSLSSPSV